MRTFNVEVIAMRTSHSMKHADRTGGTDWRLRWDRIRHCNAVVLSAMAATAWALLIAAFASLSRLFGPEAERGAWSDVIGAVIGNFVVAFVITLVVIAAVRRTRQPGP